MTFVFAIFFLYAKLQQYSHWCGFFSRFFHRKKKTRSFETNEIGEKSRRPEPELLRNSFADRRVYVINVDLHQDNAHQTSSQYRLFF